ncbi:MAG: BTAD domain-containing putative transcriptional regulator [Microbacterium sp.]
MTVRVLGPFEAGEARLSPRERAMLSALVVRLGTAVEPAELADAYWGEQVPSTWRQQVKTSIARIRSQLGGDAVVTAGSTYVLGLDPDAIDAVRFERLVSSARQRALHGEPDRASDLYARALALWRGQPYPDVSGWDPGAVEALRLTEIRTSAEEEWLDARLDAGEHRAVIAAAERLVREDPLREDRWAILALANYRAGRQADALATVRAARSRLLDELGIDVGSRLRDLETAILRQDPDIAPLDVQWDAASECPYPGLEAFRSEDADLFFGRDADVEALLERTHSGSVVAIAGPSGSGKSSVLLAGLVPRLSEGGREVAVLRPAAGGIAALRSAIARGMRVVAIDQAEELMQARAGQVAEFCEIVAEFLSADGSVVLTIRSDFLDRATELPSVGASIGRGVYVLAPLTPDALRAAIEGPARHARLRLESGLVELVVRDSSDRATTLPHVSHVLRETWVRREGATLTVAGYEAAGGLAGAIAQTAETVFRSLDAASQELCRSLLLRLVERGADGASLRRRVTAAPLVADPARRALIDTLISARLVTADGDAIVIAHEAIATAWPRLDGWLEEDAEGARLMGALTLAAETWDADGRTDDGLLRGARLHATTDWVRQAAPDLTGLEQELLAASDEHDKDEFRELAQRAARDKRNNTRLRWLVAGAGALLVAAIVGGGLAVVRGEDAARAAKNARVEALVATSLTLLDNDREAAAVLAAEAFRRWPSDPRTRSALWGALISTGGLAATHHNPDAVLQFVDMIPGTSRALRVKSSEHAIPPTVDVVDIDTGEVVDEFDLVLPAAPPDWGYAVSVSPDGSAAAIQSAVPIGSDVDECCNEQLTILDLVTGETLPGTGTVRTRMADHMTFDADGRRVYIGQPATGDVMTVDVTTGEVRESTAGAFAVPEDPGEGGFGVALIDDGLVAVSGGDQIRIYDRETLAHVRTVPLQGNLANGQMIADNRGGLVTTGWGGTVRIDIDSGAILWRRLVQSEAQCGTLHLATEDAVACGSYRGLVLLDLATGEARSGQTTLQLNRPPFFETIDDESILVSIEVPAVWMRWRIDGGGAGAEIIAKGRELMDGPEQGGSLVVTRPRGGGPMRLWDFERDVPIGRESDRIVLLGSGIVARYDGSGPPSLERTDTEERITLRIPGLPEEFEVIPGGWARPAFAVWDEGVVAFDPATGEPLGEPLAIAADRSTVWSLGETRDGRRALVTYQVEGRTETGLFDITSGEMLTGGLYGLEASHVVDGHLMLGVSESRAYLYDITSLNPLSSLPRGIGGGQRISVSADGRTLLNVGWNNALTLYDLTSGIALASPLRSELPSWELSTGEPGDFRVGGFLTADGDTLLERVSGGIRVWDLRPDEQALSACALAGRELTDEEWSTYFPGEERVATCAVLAASASEE